MRHKKKIPYTVFEKITIGPAVSEGNCIVRLEDNRVLFVKFAAPGDVVDVQLTLKKKNYLEGKIINYHHHSESRTTPFCEYFSTCGGCKWQHLNYAEQLAFKQQQVIDALERIAGITDFEILPIAGAKSTKSYRNKLDLTFSDRGWVEVFDRDNPLNFNALGFHIPGKFDKVLDIDFCHLMPDYVNEIQRGVKDFCEKNNYTFFNIREQHGLMRNLILRCNRKGEWMVLLSFFSNEKEKINALLNFIQFEFKNISSLMYVINAKKNDSITDLQFELFSGNDHLMEEIGGLKFKIRPQSFFQTNAEQAEVLYQITKEFAALSGNELVYDLYTGTGSIAIYLANQAKEIIGIEYVPEAIKDAEENAIANGITNTKFYAGDMKAILTEEFFITHGKPDVVITDPPRDGMHPDVVQRLLDAEPKRIVYVSCNPATQARDAKLLNDKYKLIKIQPVDMFPHTHHVENVGLWELR